MDLNRLSFYHSHFPYYHFGVVLFIYFYFFADTRETSFVNAITAAGLTYAVTRACTMGNLVECSCDKNQRRQQYNNVNSNDIIIDDMNNVKKRNKKIVKNIALPDGDWEWGGCGDNVHFGLRKSKEFLDSIRYKRRSDIKTLVKLHNNNAGRLVSAISVRTNLGAIFIIDV